MIKVLIPTLLLSFLAIAVVFGSISPAMADPGEEKSYKRHWAISIGDSEGTLEITQGTNLDDLKSKAISQEQATQGHDVDKAKLGKAVNSDGKYYLVWKLVEFTDSNTMTVYVLDAGTGDELTEPITKEGGSCGDKKSQSTRTSGDNA